MTDIWWTIILLGALTMSMKAVGPVALDEWTPSTRADHVLTLVSPSVLAALIVVQSFTVGQEYEFDARTIGLGAAIVAVSIRAPMPVVMLCAMIATAAARALGD